MHLDFHFTPIQILWTLTFAAHLVLLVVLLGRDRAQRFPWFTTGIALVALRLMSSRLLFGRMPQLTLSAIFIVYADLTAIVGLIVLIELARRAFHKAGPKGWIVATSLLCAIGICVLALWGKWPAWKTVTLDSKIAVLNLLQLIAQKLSLFVDVLTIGLGLLVVAIGRRFGAGWRSHTQQIVIGLSTAAISELVIQAIQEAIAHKTVVHSRADYEHVVALWGRLTNAGSVIYLAVTIWWIACMWMNEPGTADPALVAVPAGSGGPDREDAAAVKPPEEASQA